LADRHIRVKLARNQHLVDWPYAAAPALAGVLLVDII